MEDLPRAGSHPRANAPRPLARHRPAHRPPPAPPGTGPNGPQQQCRQPSKRKRRKVVQPIGKRWYLCVDRVHPLCRLLLFVHTHSAGGNDHQVDYPGTCPIHFLFKSSKTNFFSQRNNEPGFSTVPQEESPDLEYAGRDEDVIALRPEDNPYEGLKHCGLSILQEEGYQALFRAWWVTAIGGVLTALT